MTRLALIDLSAKSVVREVAAAGWIELPNGTRVSPAMAGWKGGGDVTYEKTPDGEIAVEGPPRYAIVEIDVFVVAGGKRVVGSTALIFDDKAGKAVETATVDDIPPPPAADEKVAALLSAYDLTLGEFAAVLAAAGN